MTTALTLATDPTLPRHDTSDAVIGGVVGLALLVLAVVVVRNLWRKRVREEELDAKAAAEETERAKASEPPPALSFPDGGLPAIHRALPEAVTAPVCLAPGCTEDATVPRPRIVALGGSDARRAHHAAQPIYVRATPRRPWWALWRARPPLELCAACARREESQVDDEIYAARKRAMGVARKSADAIARFDASFAERLAQEGVRSRRRAVEAPVQQLRAAGARTAKA